MAFSIGEFIKLTRMMNKGIKRKSIRKKWSREKIFMENENEKMIISAMITV